MNLCVDVGNTSVKVGLFDEDNLVSSYSFITDINKTEDEYEAIIRNQIRNKNISIKDIENVIYSSVVPEINYSLKTAIGAVTNKKPLILCPGIKTGIRMVVDNPNEVGSDLIADVVGAKEKYGYPTIIADLGTATKMLLIDKDGNFSSALIMPGISISSANLSNKAALLPSVSLETPKSVIARNTIDCMNAGMVYGHADMIVGLANRIEREIGYKCNRILTGGGSRVLVDIVKNDYQFDSILGLSGLNSILKRNLRK